MNWWPSTQHAALAACTLIGVAAASAASAAPEATAAASPLAPLASLAPLAERLDTTLSLRTGAWSGSRQLDDTGAIARASVWGRAKLNLGDGGRVAADGWIAAQSRDRAPGQQARLRELLWRVDTGALTWTLGRQLVVWGRADGLNPTDNLSPRDLTLLVPEDGEQRRGADALQVAYDAGFGVLHALWFPHAASHTIPLRAMPQVHITTERAPRKPQAALKLDLSADGIDGSVSYFHGSDPLPDLTVSALTASGLQLALRNQPLRVLGADISLARDGVVWRAEAAWMQTDSQGSDDFAHKKPRLWAVGGAEWTLSGNTTFGLQLSAQHVRDFQSPDGIADPVLRQVAWRQAAIANQTSAWQLGLLWRLASRWRNDTLMAETSGVVMNGARRDDDGAASGGSGSSGSSGTSGLWRTRLTWSISDTLQLLAGTDVYFGPARSLWGQFRDNRLAYVQLRAGW